MRVLFLIHELALNGAVTALLGMVRYLIRNGCAVTVVTSPANAEGGALRGHFLAAGACVAYTVNRNGFDVAVGCTLYSGENLASFAGRLPTVWWIHEGQSGAMYLAHNPGAWQLFQRVTRLVFPNAAVVDQYYKAYLGSTLQGHVEIVPNLVQVPATVTPTAKSEGRLRILCVGSVYPRKRQNDLIAAVQALDNPLIELVMIGEIYELEDRARDIAAADTARFRFTGPLLPDQVHGYYQTADMLSLPSADENLPLAPLEAGLHNLPVILSDLPCHDGIWRHGVNALLHPAGDVELLAWSIRMLAESAGLRLRLGRAAAANAARYSEARTCALFAAVLQEAVQAHRLR